MDKVNKYFGKLNESKFNNEEVAMSIAKEGLGYAVESYLGWKNIEDKKLARYWKQASDAMDSIRDYLKDYDMEM